MLGVSPYLHRGHRRHQSIIIWQCGSKPDETRSSLKMKKSMTINAVKKQERTDCRSAQMAISTWFRRSLLAHGATFERLHILTGKHYYTTLC
jgi:hypothetical protein